MGRGLRLNKILTRALLIFLPVSVLVYNYTASKLVSYSESRLATPMLAFLFVYASWIVFQNRKCLAVREVKYVVLFFILSLPAFFISSFYSIESYLRYFSLIAFVPLGFMSGLVWSVLFNSIDINHRDLLISVFLVPVIISVLMIANSDILMDDEISRDYVFGFIVFLPLLLYYRNNLLPLVFLVVSAVICMISAKRTGILIVASLILFLLFIKAETKKARESAFIWALVFCCLLLAAYWILPNLSPQIENSFGRLGSFYDDSNEVRFSLYERTFSEIQQSGIISLFFGHGCLATVELFGNPAHNDWLEITYDYGILPLLCIVLLFSSLVFKAIKSFKKDLTASLILSSTLVVFFITTVGNCMFTNPVAVFMLLFTLGFAKSNLKIQCQK